MCLGISMHEIDGGGKLNGNIGTEPLWTLFTKI